MVITENGTAIDCTQEGCSFGTTGICLEGHQSECPYLSSIIEDALVESNQKPDSTIQTDLYKLPPNDEITDLDIERITYSFPTKLILLVGDPESGKSTLFASLFDRFQKGSFLDYYFAGTKTPIGFERKCHHARVLSLNKISKTDRTNTKEFAYLHLSVRNKNLITAPRHLLFADVNGEKFQAARSDDNVMASLSVFKRADHICFIVDGSQLVGMNTRQIAKNNVFKLIERALQNQMISEEKGIYIIITKMDMVMTEDQLNSLEQFFIVPSKEKYGHVINSIIKVASRSKNANVPAGFGIDDFLKMALSSKPHDFNFSKNMDLKDIEHMREFQKFKYRVK